MPSPDHRPDRFRYEGYAIDAGRGEVRCHYATGGHRFTERFSLDPAGDWANPAVDMAVRLLFLLAGVSYYKTTAAPVIDLGDTASSPAERAFLTRFYQEGLGEFAFRNGLDLSDLSVEGPDHPAPATVDYAPVPDRPLIPFGGGIDSIVTVSAVGALAPDAALCIVHPPGDRFAAIEEAAAATGLPVVHVEREIDPLVRSAEHGFLNGHVPITAVITATALVAAVLGGRDAVVLSNEWSASVPTVVHHGHPINHQWSKSRDFESLFADRVTASLGSQITVFSYLRNRTELWVAQQFGGLPAFHRVFRSCNRSFLQDPAQRLDHWCGRCDKCCFIDLILAPYMEAAELGSIFDGREPLDDPQLEEQFATLLGLGEGVKPFECVGDSYECRAAVLLAAARPDRQANHLLTRLAAAVQAANDPGPLGTAQLLAPVGPDYIRIGMRPLIAWTDLRGASVGLWGLGVEGSASLRRLRSMDTTPVLVDDDPTAAQVDGLEVLATAEGGLGALLGCEVVVKSPGISRYRPEVEQLERAGIPVRGGLGLWLEEAHLERVTCITGTKGKSTTAALAGHLLNGLGYRTGVGGNIGHPPWDPSIGPEPDYWVIETSSYQVPDLTRAPPVIAVTSLSPDHLDWHGGLERYVADKLSLCTKPGVRLVIADGTDDLLRDQAGRLGPHVQWVGAEDVSASDPWIRALGLPGRHNVRNAAMARAVLVALGIGEADDGDRLAAAATGFAGLPSRCHTLGSIDGVEFVDDSLSTNVLPAQAALDAYADRRVALLVGGHDRGLDYAPLGRAVADRKQATLVVTMPDNGPRIGAAVREAAGAGTAGSAAVEVIDADDLEGAVTAAFGWSEPGGVVLLSPAAPSFGRFADYQDRARAFSEAAARCGPLA